MKRQLAVTCLLALVLTGCTAPDREPTAALDSPLLEVSQCAGVVPNTWGTAPSPTGSITSSGRARLTWPALPNVYGYQVYRRYLPAEPDWIPVTAWITTTSFTDGAASVLSGGGSPRYEYYVVSFNDYWCGGYILPSEPSIVNSFQAAPGGPL